VRSQYLRLFKDAIAPFGNGLAEEMRSPFLGLRLEGLRLLCSLGLGCDRPSGVGVEAGRTAIDYPSCVQSSKTSPGTREKS
jgi:hypothetical protein